MGAATTFQTSQSSQFDQSKLKGKRTKSLWQTPKERRRDLPPRSTSPILGMGRASRVAPQLPGDTKRCHRFSSNAGQI